jgi:hypothetical protein
MFHAKVTTSAWKFWTESRRRDWLLSRRANERCASLR